LAKTHPVSTIEEQPTPRAAKAWFRLSSANFRPDLRAERLGRFAPSTGRAQRSELAFPAIANAAKDHIPSLGFTR
jgi:hypothetical protein